MKTSDTIRKKKAMLEILEELFSQLEREEHSLHMEYRETEEMEQKTKYNRETHLYEYVFDDDGNPVMGHVWKDVEIPEDEISDYNKAKIEAYKEITKTLEKLL